jgi:hypothetical protein
VSKYLGHEAHAQSGLFGEEIKLKEKTTNARTDF